MNIYTDIATILMAIFGIVTILFVGVLMTILFLKSKQTEEKYKTNVKQILSRNYKDEDTMAAINNAYSSYKSKKYGFAYLGIVELNQQLAEELRVLSVKNSSNKEYIKMAKKIDAIINLIKDDISIEDSKANELLNKLERYIDPLKKDTIRDLKNYLIYLNSYHEGRIYEKDYQLSTLNQRKKYEKTVSTIGYIIGAVSGIVTIYQYFFS